MRKIQFFANAISDQFKGQLPPLVNANLERIKKSASRMAAMIEGVLLYTAPDAAEKTAQDIALAPLISEITTELELMIAEKNVQIKCGDLPVVRGIPALIYQLFYNLVSNAIKFSHHERQPLISITSEVISKGERLLHQIVVKDNGIGFNNVYSESIFTTFTRLHPKDKYEGTGLGLALCKKIAELHGGLISASGVEDHGATFTVQLPVISNLPIQN